MADLPAEIQTRYLQSTNPTCYQADRSLRCGLLKEHSEPDKNAPVHLVHGSTTFRAIQHDVLNRGFLSKGRRLLKIPVEPNELHRTVRKFRLMYAIFRINVLVFVRKTYFLKLS